MPCDPGEAAVELNRGYRRLDGLVHASRGVPGYIRSDNGPEFIAEAVRDWIKAVGAKTAYIEPGSPWENGYCESFNGRMRDELLNGRTLLLAARGPNHHRKLEKPLQHQTIPQCIGLSPARAKSHRPDGPKANHALTFKLDHSSGAAQLVSRIFDSKGAAHFSFLSTVAPDRAPTPHITYSIFQQGLSWDISSFVNCDQCHQFSKTFRRFSVSVN